MLTLYFMSANVGISSGLSGIPVTITWWIQAQRATVRFLILCVSNWRMVVSSSSLLRLNSFPPIPRLVDRFAVTEGGGICILLRRSYALHYQLILMIQEARELVNVHGLLQYLAGCRTLLHAISASSRSYRMNDPSDATSRMLFMTTIDYKEDFVSIYSFALL